MEQTGEYRIAAARELVWQGLNDPDVLARCIDGCLSMEKLAADRFDAAVKARIGPVSATFKAELALQDVTAPSSYVISANIKGGAAGFGRGTAEVNLEEEGGETILRYAVKASVGGKLAQVGSRLIDGAARKMADDFFLAFGRAVSGVEPLAGEPAGGRPEVGVGPGYETGGQWKIWLAVFIALALALIFAL